MAHRCQNVPAGMDATVHRRICLDYWTPFAGKWYRHNCTAEGGESCIGCGATGGLVFAFHDGTRGTNYSSTPPYAHLFCFAQKHGLTI